MPSAKEAKRAVAIIRLRGIDKIGSTMITVIARSAGELRGNGGKLMLSGVCQGVLKQLLNTKTTESVPEDSIFLATDTLGESTRNALRAANEWLTKTAAREPEKFDALSE